MGSMELHRSCPTCSAANLKVLWTVHGFTIVRCGMCTQVFVQEKLSAEELAGYYAATKDDAYVEDNADCLRYYYEKLAGLIAKRFPEPGRILDLGCSRGWFLDVMKGWECHGNEIVESDAAAARQRHGERIVTGAFEDYPLREEYFDVITLQDVFDHMRNPLEALEKCRKMLRPGGMIVIKVHNISCLYAKVTGAGFYALVPPFHLFYYDPKTLRQVLGKSGFKVVDSRFIGHILKLKTVFWRLSRADEGSLSYRIYKKLDGTGLGEFRLHKNLHDIFTMFAVKGS